MTKHDRTDDMAKSAFLISIAADNIIHRELEKKKKKKKGKKKCL